MIELYDLMDESSDRGLKRKVADRKVFFF